MTGAIAFAFLFAFGGATPALAATTFNTDPQDYQTLRVGNYTDNPNSTSASWGTTVNADAGETINLAVYYHNTGNETAQNMRVRVSPQTTGNGTTHTFTAYVWADNASQVTGNATVYLSSNQSISYKGTVVWRPNQTTWGSQTLPNSQNGSEIFSSNGILLDNIGTGWSTQGSVVVSFLVGTGSVNPPPYQNLPSVTTYQATNTSNNFAILQGYVNPNGTSDTTRWFEWGTQSYSLNNSTTKLGQGTSAGNFSETITSLSYNTTYYYRAVAQNSAGTVYGGIQSFYTTGDYNPPYYPPGGNQSPFVSTSNATNIGSSYATLNCYVNPYSTYGTTRWFEWGTTQSLGNRTTSLSHGMTAGNASETLSGLSQNATYYFRCVAQNSYGINYGTTLTFYTGGGQYYGGMPSAITNIATNVTSNSARLNGLGTNLGSQYSDGWFEWGLTQSLGNTTSHIQLGQVQSNTFYATLTSLSPNTTYYFRAVAQNQNGIDQGDILNFRTDSGYVTPVTPVTPTTPTVTKDASIMKRVANLTTPNGVDTDVAAKVGDTLRYTIEVRNTGTATIREASVKDRIPYYVEFANAEERARLDGTQREVVWFLGDFMAGEVRTVTLDVVVTADAPTGTTIENTARLEGTSFTRNSNTALIRVGTGVVAGATAAAFFGGAFLPSTFAGWLLLVIFILILVIVARKAYTMFGEKDARNGHM